MPIHANYLMQNPPLLYIEIQKKICLQMCIITSHIFICLPLLSTNKVGKHLHTHVTLVTKGKI